MNCPDCGGPMWDNRQDKRNPKSPDFKCKSKECGKGIWEKSRNGSPPPAESPTAAGPSAGKMGWRELRLTYEWCHRIASDVWPKDTPPEVIQSATATLLISADRHGLKAGVAKKAAPPPPPPPVEEELDNDLPF